MSARPQRLKINNELGIPTTLPQGEQYLQCWGLGPDTLILGPGPSPELCMPLVAPKGNVFYLHLPQFYEQMPKTWHQALPKHWQALDLEQIKHLPPGTRKILYTPLKRLFPASLAPVLAGVQLAVTKTKTRELWLPTQPQGLIVPELARAAQDLGFIPRLLPANLSSAELIPMLEQGPPALGISINFHGLDPWGENQALFAAAGVPLVVWCVDNPLHLLTAQKNKLWQQLPLFVTDNWFVASLKKLGAQPIHLPLGTDPTIFAPKKTDCNHEGLLFVGRSHFPQQDKFFAAATLPPDVQNQAKALSGRQGHFGWWQTKLKIPLWPGQKVRNLGLGAELQSRKWRCACLQYLAAHEQLTIIGDQHWRQLLPGIQLRPPVDYYHGLARAYQEFSMVLNLTSLLLPHGLTQRHFDVWACGGFLLSDNTPGLDIFPQDLTQDISFSTPAQALERVRYFATHEGHKKDLAQAWQKHILAEHSYKHRLQTILDYLETRFQI